MTATAATFLLGASPAGADDLNCGDPGTWHNMPVGPDDPHGLDREGDGIGCEDASAFGPDGQPIGQPPTPPPPAQPPATPPPAPAPSAPPAPDPAPAPAPAPEAPPAAPVERQPSYTG